MASLAALAQVHWDVGAQIGAMERVVRHAAPGAATPTPGPMAEAHAHVAVMPMLRMGPYLAYDLSPVAGAPARQMAEAGLRAKVTPPLFRAPWRIWAFVGAGYARTYAPSYHVSSLAPGAGMLGDVLVGGAAGGLLDLPIGVGMGYRLRYPWELFAELGGRVVLVTTGSMSEGAQCLCQKLYTGNDAFALSLSVGVSLDQ